MYRNIFIFGGSFDPLHFGHLALIKSILKQGDELWLVPSGSNPEGKNYCFSSFQRLVMLRAALGILCPQEIQTLRLDQKSIDLLQAVPRCSSKIIIREDELLKQEKSYTIDLIKSFKEELPQASFNLVVGADQAQKFWRWKDPEQLISLVSLWTVPRDSWVPVGNIAWNFLQMEKCSISSTEVRRLLLENPLQSHLKNLVPEPVLLLAFNFLEK